MHVWVMVIAMGCGCGDLDWVRLGLGWILVGLGSGSIVAGRCAPGVAGTLFQFGSKLFRLSSQATTLKLDFGGSGVVWLKAYRPVSAHVNTVACTNHAGVRAWRMAQSRKGLTLTFGCFTSISHGSRQGLTGVAHAAQLKRLKTTPVTQELTFQL